MHIHQAYQSQGGNRYCHFYIENFATCETPAQIGIISDRNSLPWEDKEVQILPLGINSCRSRGYVLISCAEALPANISVSLC